MCVISENQKLLWKNKAMKGGEWSDCCLSGKLWRDGTKAATLMNLCFLLCGFYNTLGVHCFHDRKLFPESTATNQPVLQLRKSVYIRKTVWGCVGWVRSVFWEIRGKVSLSQCLPLFCLLESPRLWLEDKVCWVVCLYWWKNSHPQTDPRLPLGGTAYL